MNALENEFNFLINCSFYNAERSELFCKICDGYPFYNRISAKYFLNSSKFDIRHVKCLNVSTFLIKIETCSTLLRNHFLHLIYLRNFYPLTIMDQPRYCV